MKKLTLFSLELIPFFIGYGMNRLMFGRFFNMNLPYRLISIAFLAAWFLPANIHTGLQRTKPRRLFWLTPSPLPYCCSLPIRSVFSGITGAACLEV